MRNAASFDSISQSEINGFLTGIAIQSDLGLSSEWLLTAWSSCWSAFYTERQSLLEIHTIMEQYQRICCALETGREAYASMFHETFKNTLDAINWATGFVAAIQLHHNTWEALLEDRENFTLLMPILVLCRGIREALLFGVDPIRNAKLLASSAERIPACVANINAFCKERHQDAPCACGSGRFYKRCCGAN